MIERLSNGFNPDLYHELRLTESAIKEYADHALEYGVIDVVVQDCRYPLMQLPLEISEACKGLKRPPKIISGVDLKMKYNRDELRFATTDARLRFDNHYSLNFHRVISRLTNRTVPAYIASLLDPTGKEASGLSETQLLTVDHFEDVLQEVGLEMPHSPREASWDGIRSILGFSGRWNAAVSLSTTIDPISTLIVKDTTEGRNRKNQRGRETGDAGLQRRQITISIDEADDIAQPPTKSWKINATSQNRGETPTIESISLVPLEFVPPMMDIPEFDMQIVVDGFDKRQEVTQEEKRFPISDVLLKAARDAIKMAMR